jgi:hypothetical protein
MEWKHQLIEAGLALAGLVITALAGIVSGFVTKWLSSRAQSNDIARVAFKVWEKTQNVVAHLAVHGGAELRQVLSDGKVTAEEGKLLKDRGMALLLEQLGPGGLDEIRDVLGVGADQLAVFLSGLIERALTVYKAPTISSAPDGSLLVSKPS